MPEVTLVLSGILAQIMIGEELKFDEEAIFTHEIQIPQTVVSGKIRFKLPYLNNHMIELDNIYWDFNTGKYHLNIGIVRVDTVDKFNKVKDYLKQTESYAVRS